jgi:hypothetical protein
VECLAIESIGRLASYIKNRTADISLPQPTPSIRSHFLFEDIRNGRGIVGESNAVLVWGYG